MKKSIQILIMILVSSALFSAIDPKTVGFNLEFAKEGVYEFAFYESSSSSNEISYLVFSPVDKANLAGAYKTSFAVKWNIQSPLDYKLFLEFSSTNTGSATADYMMKNTIASNGLNFSYDASGSSKVFSGSEVTSMISAADRTVIVKDGKANEAERSGSADISLTLNPPTGTGFTQGQYIGYIRMVLQVG